MQLRKVFGGRAAHQRHALGGHAMHQRRDAPGLCGQVPPDGVEGRIAQDAPAQGLAVDPAHQESVADAVFRLRHCQHLGHRHAGPRRALDQFGLDFEPDRHVAERAPPAACAAG